ncbi:cell division protein FtsN [Dysgonomonadaceae bacterium PH5-43]|nr:cell division protein FtsN [Dysgonomonadaceae bacterium PH5-43]
MKSKFLIYGLAIAFTFSLSACKTKQSNYNKVLEQAQQKAIAEAEEAEIEVAEEVEIMEMAPVEKEKPVVKETFQVEKVTAVEGSVKDYSVVIGSFINKTNAESLKNRMVAQGYKALLAKNERDMYRVIVATFDNKSDAISAREQIKTKYAPNFNDAWLLQKGY